MGMIKCVPAKKRSLEHKYTALLFTGGPWSATTDKPTARRELTDVARGVYGDNLAKVIVAMEVGKDGYQHYHVGVVLKKRDRWSKFNDKCLEYVRTHPAPDQPQKPNGWTYHFATDCRNPSAELLKYVTNPTKEKSVDDDTLEFEQPDYSQMLWCRRWFLERYDGVDTGLKDGPFAFARDEVKRLLAMKARGYHASAPTSRLTGQQYWPKGSIEEKAWKEWVERCLVKAKDHLSIIEAGQGA